MAAYRRVYDSRHLQADCKEPGSAPELYARQSSRGYLYLLPGADVQGAECPRFANAGSGGRVGGWCREAPEGQRGASSRPSNSSPCQCAVLAVTSRAPGPSPRAPCRRQLCDDDDNNNNNTRNVID